MISISSWRKIIVHFDSSKLQALQNNNAYLYVLQDVISTSPKLCSISFGVSINLNILNNKTSLTILVDKWPFWFAAYANPGIIPSNWEYNKLSKQSLYQNFFEIYDSGSSSPEIKLAQPEMGTSPKLDVYNLRFDNQSSNSFYIGLGRALQWGAGEKEINDGGWEESIVGCNCFFLLDSNSTTYFRPSDGIVILISTQKWQNGNVLPELLAGYAPCYFELKEKEIIILDYKNAGWTKRSGNPKLQLFDNQKLAKKLFEDCLVKDMSIEPSDKPKKLHYGDLIKLCIPKNNGYITSASYEIGGLSLPPKNYFPRFSSSDAPINLLLSGGSGVIKDGDTVKIETTETVVGEYKVLGAWITPTLYYDKGGYGKKQEWTIRKKINSDSTIYYSDEVYFLNHYYKEQWLCIKDQGPWLTTKENANVYWLIDEP